MNYYHMNTGVPGNYKPGSDIDITLTGNDLSLKECGLQIPDENYLLHFAGSIKLL